MSSRSALLIVATALAGAWAGEGPVCRWDFDGSLADRGSGRSRDGLVARDAHGRPARARFVSAATLPGTVGRALALGVEPDDAAYLTAPDSPPIRLGHSYTIAAWIHPTHISGWNRLVLNWGPAPHYAYHLAIHDGIASLYHGQADGRYLCAEGGRIEPGRWVHLVGIARRSDTAPAKSTLEVYLNGRRTATAPYDGTFCATARGGLGIGDSAAIPSAGSRFRGYLDDVALWNRALSADEVAALVAPRARMLREAELARQREERARHATACAEVLAAGVGKIVFAERAPGRDPSGHYYANFGYACTDPDTWLHGADGGRLVKLDVRTGEVTALVDDIAGAVRDPQVHYDGRRILFSYRRGGTHHYNLYEVRADGSGLRQLTRGPWDDIEPAYLPDGGIIFCSTRCKRYIGCWLAPSATLHRCDADGRRIRLLSSGAFTENTPAVLPDGRVLYTRWEYVNRDPVSFHHLWTMNPDGTGQMVYFGNMHPGGVFIDAQPIPGTERVLFVHSPGHGRNEHAGHVATVTGRLGPDARPAMRHTSRAATFRDPYPLTDGLFLVARGRQVLVMNDGGGAHVLHEGGAMVHEPRPLVARAREPVVAPRLDLTQATGTLVLTDVYQGRAMQGVPRGAITRLLVLEDLPKPANFHGGGSQPIGHGVTSTLKRVLGTVRVEADGSACFQVPALRSIYLAALDASDRSV
ncbi:hypothetical protein HQ576_09980, partial [bacterium]|nr:hypothetical protein [bacterium]